jgi:hypothetical protein
VKGRSTTSLNKAHQQQHQGNKFSFQTMNFGKTYGPGGNVPSKESTGHMSKASSHAQFPILLENNATIKASPFEQDKNS